MFDPEIEPPITLLKASNLHLLGRRVSYQTLCRWHRPGLLGVRLETIRIGGKTYTSVEAVKRFIAGVTAARHSRSESSSSVAASVDASKVPPAAGQPVGHQQSQAILESAGIR